MVLVRAAAQIFCLVVFQDLSVTNAAAGSTEIGEVFLEESIHRKLVAAYGLRSAVDLDMLIICGDWTMLSH